MVSSSFVSVGILLITCLTHVAASAELKVSEWDRSIDLKTQIVKVTHTIRLRNVAKSSPTSFNLALDENTLSGLMFVKAESINPDQSAVPAKFTWPSSDGRLEVEIPPSDDGQAKIQVVLHWFGLNSYLSMFPANVSQSENQMVLFNDVAYVNSMDYSVAKQKTSIVLPSSAIESYTKVDPTSKSGSGITYGPYTEDVAKSPPKAISVHFPSPVRHLVVRKLTRTVYISMWGKIAIEEHIVIQNTGAKLNGPFSRLDYQMQSSQFTAQQNAVESYVTKLPRSADGIYYRDDIGIIWSSETKVAKRNVLLQLSTRFPLMGGWKTYYFIGYTLPSQDLISYKAGSDEYVLNIALLDHIFDDMIVEEAEFRIVLPEMAKISTKPVRTSFTTERLPDDVHYSAFDWQAREVIRFKNVHPLGEKHISNIRLHFTWHLYDLFIKPILIFVSFLTLFLVSCILLRLDLTLGSKKSDSHSLSFSTLGRRMLDVHLNLQNAIFKEIDAHLTKRTPLDLGKVVQKANQIDGEMANLVSRLRSESRNKMESTTADKAKMLLDVGKAARDARIVAVECQQQTQNGTCPVDSGVQQKISDLDDNVNSALIIFEANLAKAT